MASERASTTRQRLSGRICCACRVPLSPPAGGQRVGERYCEACAAQCSQLRPPLQVSVYLSYRRTPTATPRWECTIHDANIRHTLHRLCFADSAKIEELIARTPTVLDLAARQSIALGIQRGRGGIHLQLTAAQFKAINSRA